MTTIWTTTSDADGTKVAQVCLAVTDSGSVVALPPPAKVAPDSSGVLKPVDPTVYAKELKQQQWILTCTSNGGSVKISNVNYPLSADFQLQSNYSQNYLNLDSTGNKVVMKTTAQTWTCSMQPVGPSSFTYSCDPWVLSTTSRDQLVVPQMSSPGSQPLTWSIAPNLPQGLKLIDGDDAKAGDIAIVSGSTPVASPATQYTVTALITINGLNYKSTGTITVEVDVPPSGLQS